TSHAIRALPSFPTRRSSDLAVVMSLNGSPFRALGTNAQFRRSSSANVNIARCCCSGESVCQKFIPAAAISAAGLVNSASCAVAKFEMSMQRINDSRGSGRRIAGLYGGRVNSLLWFIVADTTIAGLEDGHDDRNFPATG